ncbi:MAG: hypothetical protein ACR2MN_11050, partial [Acidimicrobiales bacterium]
HFKARHVIERVVPPAGADDVGGAAAGEELLQTAKNSANVSLRRRSTNVQVATEVRTDGNVWWLCIWRIDTLI